jgi:hypothetical protein
MIPGPGPSNRVERGPNALGALIDLWRAIRYSPSRAMHQAMLDAPSFAQGFQEATMQANDPLNRKNLWDQRNPKPDPEPEEEDQEEAPQPTPRRSIRPDERQVKPASGRQTEPR